MSELTLWMDSEISKLRQEMDHLYDRMCHDFGIGQFTDFLREGPRFNISETEESLVLRAKLPDFDPEDLDISITGDLLIIKGRRTKNVSYKMQDVDRTGSFSTRINLPSMVRIEDVRATYKGGILEIVMPKYRVSVSQHVKILKK